MQQRQLPHHQPLTSGCCGCTSPGVGGHAKTTPLNGSNGQSNSRIPTCGRAGTATASGGATGPGTTSKVGLFWSAYTCLVFVVCQLLVVPNSASIVVPLVVLFVPESTLRHGRFGLVETNLTPLQLTNHLPIPTAQRIRTTSTPFP